jgi:hypothetical protein
MKIEITAKELIETLTNNQVQRFKKILSELFQKRELT